MRDPAEAALNELQKRCREAAELHQQAAETAERAEDRSVAALFRALARSRREATERLERRLAAMGELPEDTDPDAETLKKLVTAARTWLSAEEGQALLEQRSATETQILEAAEAALAEDLSPESRALVVRVREEVERARALLEAAHREGEEGG